MGFSERSLSGVTHWQAGSPFLCWLYIAKREIIKHLEVLKTKCYFETFNSHNLTNFININKFFARFLYRFKLRAKNYRRMFKRMCLHIITCSQIWLNLPMDYRHFGYITKLTKKRCITSARPSLCSLTRRQKRSFTHFFSPCSNFPGFVFQICDATELAIIHNSIAPNLAMNTIGK
jgi:hypothetical protein